MPQMLFWLAATVVFLLIEWPTMGLTTIWFAGGSLVAGLLAVFSFPFPIQFALDDRDRKRSMGCRNGQIILCFENCKCEVRNIWK